jgi:hypothetical protein
MIFTNNGLRQAQADSDKLMRNTAIIKKRNCNGTTG